MYNLLKHITGLGWVTAILLSLLLLGLWVPSFIANPLLCAVTCTLALFNAMLLIALLYRTGVTRVLSGMPMVCYLCLMGMMPALHTLWQSQVAVLCLLTVILLLHLSWRKNPAVQESFGATLLLCAAGLFMPDMLVFVPLLWGGMMMQRAFSVRTWMASLTAIALVALYGWIAWHWFDWTLRLASPYEAFLLRNVGLPSGEIIPAALIVLFGFFFAVCGLLDYNRENVSVQSLFVILTAILLVTAILMFFPPVLFPSAAAAAVCATAGLAAVFFTSHQSLFAGISFLLFLLLPVAVTLLHFFGIY